MGISPENFLRRYFTLEQLKEPLADIGLSVGGTKNEKIKRITDNWITHHRNWYELLDYLEWGDLSRICDDFGINYSDYNKEETLCQKIEDEMVLDFRNKTTKDKATQTIKNNDKPNQTLPSINILGKNINIGNNNKIISNNKIAAQNGMSKETKISIILGILALVIGVPSLYYAMNPPLDEIAEIIDERIGLEKIESNENTYPDGEYGNRFTSLKGGFTVEKPNEKWDLISNVNAYREKQGKNVPETAVDAVEFQRPGLVNIVVSVQKPITEADKKLTVSGWFDLAIYLKMLRGVTVEPLKTHISPEGDFGYTKYIETENGNQFFHYETVRFYNDQFYSFHISSILPDKLPQDVIDEINSIFNSYKILET